MSSDRINFFNMNQEGKKKPKKNCGDASHQKSKYHACLGIPHSNFLYYAAV
jgi:hypothetical protein